jgi:hypothetical protein
MSRSQFLEWMVYAKIRGPIGPLRQDYYTYYLALHGGRQYDEKATVEGIAATFPMPWLDPDNLRE